MKNLAIKVFSVSALIWALVGLSLVDFEAANSSEIYGATAICVLGGILFSVIPSTVFVLSKRNADSGKGGARFFYYGGLVTTVASFLLIPILITTSAGRLDDSILFRLGMLFGVVFVGTISGGACGVLTRERSDPNAITKPFNPWFIVVLAVAFEVFGIARRISIFGAPDFSGDDIWIYVFLSIRVIVVYLVIRTWLVRYKERLSTYEALKAHVANRGKTDAEGSAWGGEVTDRIG